MVKREGWIEVKLYWVIAIIILVPLMIFVPGEIVNDTHADEELPRDEQGGEQDLSERESKQGEEYAQEDDSTKEDEEHSDEEKVEQNGQDDNGDEEQDYEDKQSEKSDEKQDESNEEKDEENDEQNEITTDEPSNFEENSEDPGWLISRWDSTGGPYSGEILSLTQDPHEPNHMYAGTPYGLFKSFNKGENWYDLGVTESEINDIAVSKVDSDLVYLATNEGLYLSRDGGAQWDFHQGAIEGRKINFVTTQQDPIFNETALVGTDEGVYVSRTNGRSFTLTGFEEQRVTAGKIHESSPEQLYLAVEDEGLVVSENRGNTWETISDDFVGEVLTISFNPSFPYIKYLGTTNGIYASYDSGINWEHEGVLGTPVYDIWMDPELPIHIVAATEGKGVKRSTSAGDEWSTVSEDLQDVDLLSMITDIDDSSRFYFGTGEKGIISMGIEDSDYAVLNEGLTNYIHDLYASNFDPDSLTAVSDESVYYTEDRGDNWSELLDERPKAVASWYNPEDVKNVEVDANDDKDENDAQAEQMYLAVDEELLITNPGSGETESVSLEQLERQIYNLEVHPLDKDQIWAGTDQGVYVSKDRGENWQKLGLTDRFVEYLDVAYDPDNEVTVAYAGGYDGVSRYVEVYGDKELEDDSHPAVNEEGELDEQVKDLYGEVNEFNAIISRDDYALSQLEAVDFDPTQVWLGTLGRGLYHSENAGEDFTAKNDGLPGSDEDDAEQYIPTVHDLEVYSQDTDRVLAGLESGVYFSHNSGEQWQTVNDLQIRAESFSAHFGPPTAMYLGTEEGVYRHEAYEIPYMGWEDEEHYSLENPDIYRFQEEFELKNDSDETEEDVVFMAPKVLNHGIYQFQFDYDIDPEPVETITEDNFEAEDEDAYDVEESWFEMGNELLVFEKDELEPGETWEITAENEVVVFETYYDVDNMEPKSYDTDSQLYQQYTAPDEMSPADEEVIKERAADIVGDAEGPIDKAEKIFDWVKDYLEYVPPGNVGALEAYKTGEGVCADYSDLFVALARAEGIPARRLSGYYISGPDEGQYHAWSEFYLEGYGWVPVEPTFEAWYSDFFGELPDTSHIFMSYGIVRHEFTTGIDFDESFSIEQVSLEEMGFSQEDVLETLEEESYDSESLSEDEVDSETEDENQDEDLNEYDEQVDDEDKHENDEEQEDDEDHGEEEDEEQEDDEDEEQEDDEDEEQEDE